MQIAGTADRRERGAIDWSAAASGGSNSVWQTHGATAAPDEILITNGP